MEGVLNLGRNRDLLIRILADPEEIGLIKQRLKNIKQSSGMNPYT